MIKINHVGKFVGRHQKGSVIGAIRSDASIRVLPRLGKSSDVVADPTSSSVTSVDPTLRMISLEALEQFAEVLIGGQSIRVVSASCRCNVITPLIVSPTTNTVISNLAL